ncbi:MAG TPA: polysaccharide biosynthesis protein, partial [Opitutales bacterium]|nr:polysaccharide biosynthesis protein [Opitutales bacterium]
MFSNKTLLITGGTGSFGNAVLRRFLGSDIGEIRIFSRDEKKQDDMRRIYRDGKLRFYIGDVRSPDSLKQAMAGVDYVFHAAALKQVPSCEFYPMEAVRTNIIGTDNVLQAAQDAGVQRVVVLSTDKAAYPINAMGISKAMMEKVMVARSRLARDTGCVFCGTRYGNVMASRGSVIPFFVYQIQRGQPLTVTDPRMTRFMMSLDDAVNLVLYAFQNGRAGDMFVQKAPASTIGDLATALQDILGARNREVTIIGRRHGEKLYDTLLTREERARAEDLSGYFRLPVDNRDLNYDQYHLGGDVSHVDCDDYNSHNTVRLDVAGVKELLLKLECVQKAM